MPRMNSKKKRSAATDWLGRAMTRPMAPAREADRARAAALGVQPISLATARMRRRVVCETPLRPLRAKETAEGETPATVAMSRIVGRSMVGVFHCSGGDGAGGLSCFPSGNPLARITNAV